MPIKIDKNQEVTSRLGFKPLPQFNNFCLGFLTNVEVTESEISNDSKWEFKGKTVPRLAFHFDAWRGSTNDPERFYGKSEMLIAGINNKGEAITDDNLVGMYTELWKRIKHLHDQYRGTANYKEMDFDVAFEPKDPIDKRIADMKTFFNNVAKAFNSGKNKKAIYADNSALLAMKLIKTSKKTKKGKTYFVLDLPNYVGKGYLQAVKVVDGKIDTTLEFTGTETVDLTAAPVAAAGGDAKQFNASGVPADVAEELGI